MDALGHVLVVDDDEAIRHLVRSVLEDEGYRVLCAEDTESALHVIDESDVRLVLLDLVLQNGTGEEFLERYQDGREASAPVVLLTAWKTGDLPPGIAGYLAKPFDIDALVAVVREHLPAPRGD